MQSDTDGCFRRSLAVEPGTAATGARVAQHAVLDLASCPHVAHIVTPQQVVRELTALRVAERFLPTVSPLVHEDHRGRAQVEGSCVLLAVDQFKFLLTAGHVLDSSRPLVSVIRNVGWLI